MLLIQYGLEKKKKKKNNKKCKKMSCSILDVIKLFIYFVCFSMFREKCINLTVETLGLALEQYRQESVVNTCNMDQSPGYGFEPRV